MKVMCFTEEEISDVLQVIAGVLQLGNVHFMAAGGAQVAEKSGMSDSVLMVVLLYGELAMDIALSFVYARNGLFSNTDCCKILVLFL